jgi:hypothetical protein
MMILITGPYRGGKKPDPELMKKNFDELKSAALLIFRLGHIPMFDQWVALPLIQFAGSMDMVNENWDELQYPVTRRLLEKCDAVLRLEGESTAADDDVRIAKERGLKIYYNPEDIPFRYITFQD